MSYVANLELCKELYELSGWGNGGDMDKLKWLDYYDDWSVPAYDLGYLLRKLPHPMLFLSTSGDGNDWVCDINNPDTTCSADTPEDAACKLAIELYKSGIIS